MSESDKSKDVRWIWFLFSTKGRINRQPFWIFNFIVFAGWFVLGMFTERSVDINEITRPQLMFLVWILWPSLAVQAKRWHDRNKSALWIFIGLIPLIGPLWALVENGFLPGTPGENRFGPDPLEHPLS